MDDCVYVDGVLLVGSLVKGCGVVSITSHSGDYIIGDYSAVSLSHAFLTSCFLTSCWNRLTCIEVAVVVRHVGQSTSFADISIVEVEMRCYPSLQQCSGCASGCLS